MKKIQVKAEGFTSQELSYILSEFDTHEKINFELEKAKEGERALDIVNFFIENYQTIASAIGVIYIAWNQYIKLQELKLDKQKHELNKQKFEHEKQKYEDEINKLKTPKTAIIQQITGDDLYLPFSNEKEIQDFLQKKNLNLRTENIKSIYLK